jgi:hypothetical protein
MGRARFPSSGEAYEPAFSRALRGISKRAPIEEKIMMKVTSLVALAAGFVLLSGAALAEQGNSTAWGTVGWGPVIPTQSLTPRERAWNNDNLPLYHAGDSSEWLRQHGKGLFPFFQ